MQGKVKWYSSEKLYGFLTPDDGGKDIFIHRSGVKVANFETFAEDQRVEFDLGEGRKGPQAINVVPVA